MKVIISERNMNTDINGTFSFNNICKGQFISENILEEKNDRREQKKESALLCPTEKRAREKRILSVPKLLTHAPHLGGKCGNIVTIVNITPVA